MALMGQIHFDKHSHVAYQIEGNEEKNTVVQNLPRGHVWGVTRGKKV